MVESGLGTAGGGRAGMEVESDEDLEGIGGRVCGVKVSGEGERLLVLV